MRPVVTGSENAVIFVHDHAAYASACAVRTCGHCLRDPDEVDIPGWTDVHFFFCHVPPERLELSYPLGKSQLLSQLSYRGK